MPSVKINLGDNQLYQTFPLFPDPPPPYTHTHTHTQTHTQHFMYAVGKLIVDKPCVQNFVFALITKIPSSAWQPNHNYQQ